MENPEAPPYLISLDDYLDMPDQLAMDFPSSDEVKAAIFTFCPFDHETGTFLCDSVASLQKLTRILYLPFYPEHLNLLSSSVFIHACINAMEEYLETYKLFDRAFGLIMLKVLSLWTMIAILARKGQLRSFMESSSPLDPTRRNRNGFTPQLISLVTDIIDL